MRSMACTNWSRTAHRRRRCRAASARRAACGSRRATCSASTAATACCPPTPSPTSSAGTSADRRARRSSARLPSTVSGTCSVKRCSLKVPSAPPSPLAPLSEISITSVLSSSPSASSCASTRPICASVCERKPANTSCCARQHALRVARASDAHSSIQLGRRSERRARGDDAVGELPREDVGPPLLPPAVERAAVGLDPLRRDVVRRVHRAEREVQEEGAVGCGLVLRGDRVGSASSARSSVRW